MIPNKRLQITLLFFSLLFALPAPGDAAAKVPEGSGEPVQELLHRLDGYLDQREIYGNMRQERIDHLKNILTGSRFNGEQYYNIHSLLADEYGAFQFDSTLRYLTLNLDLARLMGDRRRADETLLRMAHLYSTSGYYLEASDILGQRLDTLTMDPSLLGEFYVTYCRFCSETREYSRNPSLSLAAENKRLYYTHRILEWFPADSDVRLKHLCDYQVEQRNLDGADSTIGVLLRREQPNSHNYAIYAYTKSMIQGYRGDLDGQVGWLARSAAADLQAAIRDNASLCLLSQILFGRGEVSRAFRYIQTSMDDALFYNARLRPWQIASTLPIIESAYLAKQKQQFRVSVCMGIIILVLCLIAGVIALLEIRQKRRAEQMHARLQEANGQLNEYIERLSQINESQNELNREIRESNTVKEEYIGLFLSICSDYIDKMKEYQRYVRKKLSSGGAAELQRELNSSAVIDSYIEEFYHTFDNAFLKLYPDFVSEFNSLLQDDARIELKKGQQLNTELRIFALIRLGIDDSSKIAGLLRYSVNTIYNYRAKVKNNAKVSREAFEEKIKKIGSFLHET